MGNDTLVAVDLAKSVFQLAVSDRPGKVIRRERLSRDKFLEFFAQQPVSTVIMEACGSAHYWGRRIEELGHTVVLLPPQYVRPYVLRNKTDRTDTDAMLEAYRNQQIRAVPIKSVTQQVLGTLHRLRSGWVGERTARVNALRGLLRELGFFIPVGRREVLPHAWEIIQDANSGLPDALRPSLAALCEEIVGFSKRIADIEKQLNVLAQQVPAVGRVYSVPGIGILTRVLERLTPTPWPHLKRGDAYLRTLLVHGARAILWHAKRLEQPDRLRAWALRLEKKIGHNKAAVALANKLARIAWAVWKNDRDFAPVPETQAA